MRSKDKPEQMDADRGRASEISESEIDENLEDSFPASDPPAWTLGSNHRAHKEEKSEGDEQENNKSGV